MEDRHDPTEEAAGSEEPPPIGIARHASIARIITFGLAGGAFVLLLASNTVSVVRTEELVGFALIIIGALELVNVLYRRRSRGFIIAPMVAVGAGAVLAIWPAETLRIAGVTLGVVIIVRGVLDFWAAVRRWHNTGENSWIFIRGLIGIVAGLFVLLSPRASVQFVIIAVAAAMIVRAVLTVWFLISERGAQASIDPGDTTAVITYWLTRHELTAEEAESLEHTVFVHSGDASKRLWRFAVFLVLSTIIATFGIATNSTAVVIGAMLIAPLMAPILGISAGLINGRMRAATISAVVVALGAILTIFIAWLCAAMIPDLDAVIENSQVTSRTSPNLLDLAIAIAAGAAGAYGVSRVEVSDALPGVAVAIALVPPLSVMGITLHANDLAQAGGAYLLFLTNLFSIILMAGAVFLFVGYGEWSRLYYRKDRIRTSFAVVAFGFLVIAIPLTLTGQDILRQSTDLRNASHAVSIWLGDESEMRINTIAVSDDEVRVQLIGPSPGPPSPSTLSRIMGEEVGRPMATRIAWIEEHLELTR